MSTDQNKMPPKSVVKMASYETHRLGIEVSKTLDTIPEAIIPAGSCETSHDSVERLA
jgi:hypothetical protein